MHLQALVDPAMMHVKAPWIVDQNVYSQITPNKICAT